MGGRVDKPCSFKDCSHAAYWLFEKNWIAIEKMLKWMYNEVIKDLNSWTSTDSFLVPENPGNQISHQVKDDMHKFASRKFTKGVLQFLQLGNENKCFANSKKVNRLRARLNCDYFIITGAVSLEQPRPGLGQIVVPIGECNKSSRMRMRN